MAAADLLLGPPPSLADFRLGAARRGTERGCGSREPTGDSRGPSMWTIFSGKQRLNQMAK
uniref:Calmodulin like 4 n=1 Tax=Lynx canadensis TaxID=61383 RepID=A0A667H604_LYNCA